MALNIKDAATEKSVRELADATGESLTTAIRLAVDERLQRVRRRKDSTLLADILAIASHCASLPTLDSRTPEEILGYDEHGLPT